MHLKHRHLGLEAPSPKYETRSCPAQAQRLIRVLKYLNRSNAEAPPPTGLVRPPGVSTRERHEMRGPVAVETLSNPPGRRGIRGPVDGGLHHWPRTRAALGRPLRSCWRHISGGGWTALRAMPRATGSARGVGRSTESGRPFPAVCLHLKLCSWEAISCGLEGGISTAHGLRRSSRRGTVAKAPSRLPARHPVGRLHRTGGAQSAAPGGPEVLTPQTGWRPQLARQGAGGAPLRTHR